MIRSSQVRREAERANLRSSPQNRALTNCFYKTTKNAHTITSNNIKIPVGFSEKVSADNETSSWKADINFDPRTK